MSCQTEAQQPTPQQSVHASAATSAPGSSACRPRATVTPLMGLAGGRWGSHQAAQAESRSFPPCPRPCHPLVRCEPSATRGSRRLTSPCHRDALQPAIASLRVTARERGVGLDAPFPTLTGPGRGLCERCEASLCLCVPAESRRGASRHIPPLHHPHSTLRVHCLLPNPSVRSVCVTRETALRRRCQGFDMITTTVRSR